jgi:hypothetical protein
MTYMPEEQTLSGTATFYDLGKQAFKGTVPTGFLQLLYRGRQFLRLLRVILSEGSFK